MKMYHTFIGTSNLTFYAENGTAKINTGDLHDRCRQLEGRTSTDITTLKSLDHYNFHVMMERLTSVTLDFQDRH